MKGFKKIVSLIWIDIKVNCFELLEYCKVLFKFYRNVPFMLSDLRLIATYLFKNPYKMSKYFLEEKGESNVYTYGETPLTTLEIIAKECSIGPHDVFYELGCGRGRTCFWMRYIIGCKTVGIEMIPEFVMIAEGIQKGLETKNLEFRLQDFLKANLSEATVIFLYGSTMDEYEITRLNEKLSKLRSGVAVMTVSFPLNDYSKAEYFEIMKRFPVSFPWGTADVYLQYKK